MNLAPTAPDLGAPFALDWRPTRTAVPAPTRWRDWLATLFPKYVRHPFAGRHVDFWEHIWTIDADGAPRPFVAIWPRGGGKSTSTELAVAALGVRGKRRYAWYVRETQEQADKSVENIAGLLESGAVETYYPDHAARAVTKYGQSKGWRRSRLRTEGGFTIDALGLDTASRGLKVDEQRPDLIIFDDIDGKHDSVATTAKKAATITTSILPAGSGNVAVIAVQNLIIAHGIFTRLADGRADFLVDRVVSGPFPAVEGMETEWRWNDGLGTRQAVITAGEATWAGQSLATCQRMIDTMGLSAFQKECQHRVKDRAEGVALNYDPARHLVDLTDQRARDLVAMGSAFAGVDFGAWRFGYTLYAADEKGRPHEIAEYFSQRETLETRARAIHAINTHYRVPAIMPTWGDAANPTDIMELNQAFIRIKSPYRVVAVAMENKMRRASVDRLNDLLDRDALVYRRDVAQAVARILADATQRPASDFLNWRVGYNAGSEGTLMTGPRLHWELERWAYPVPKEGIAQDQDPDDDTADGADLLASTRYAIMSWWSAGRIPADVGFHSDKHAGWNVTRTGTEPRRDPKPWERVMAEQQKQQQGAERRPVYRMPSRRQYKTVED